MILCMLIYDLINKLLRTQRIFEFDQVVHEIQSKQLSSPVISNNIHFILINAISLSRAALIN